MATIFHYLSSILILSILQITIANKCKQTNQCICEFDQYSQINLDSLLPHNQLFVHDTIIVETNFTSYYFSGCKDAPIKPDNFNDTITASLVKCVHYKYKLNNNTDYKTDCYSLGAAKDTKFEAVGSSSNYLIHYKNAKENNTSTIFLECTIDKNHTDIKINDAKFNDLTLYSSSACVRHIEHHELSSWSIFWIIFFSFALTYFVGGGLVLHFIRGARGVEMIPNYSFWSRLPGYLKNGLIFLLNGCRTPPEFDPGTYDRI